MGRTTDEWAELLDYTTPEPWFANVRGFGRIENIGPISTGFSIGDGLDCDEHDAELAAAAPEAVAEVIRLRRAITDLRDKYLEHIADVLHHSASRDLFVDQVSGLVVEIREDVDDYYGTAAALLDRILNGDTDD